MTLRATLEDLFMDPISHDRMTDPVMNKLCGHTYEKVQIEGWRAACIARGDQPLCPLCRSRIDSLASNMLVKQALEALDAPVNALAGRVEDLTDEEKEVVEAAINEIRRRRQEDQQNEIPVRIPEKQSFIQKVKSFYGCA